MPMVEAALGGRTGPIGWRKNTKRYAASLFVELPSLQTNAQGGKMRFLNIADASQKPR